MSNGQRTDMKIANRHGPLSGRRPLINFMGLAVGAFLTMRGKMSTPTTRSAMINISFKPDTVRDPQYWYGLFIVWFAPHSAYNLVLKGPSWDGDQFPVSGRIATTIDGNPQ